MLQLTEELTMGLFPNDLWFYLLKVFIRACWANILSCFNNKQLKLILSLDFLGTIDQERNYYKTSTSLRSYPLSYSDEQPAGGTLTFCSQTCWSFASLSVIHCCNCEYDDEQSAHCSRLVSRWTQQGYIQLKDRVCQHYVLFTVCHILVLI